MYAENIFRQEGSNEDQVHQGFEYGNRNAGGVF